MRSLRERLAAVRSAPSTPRPAPRPPEPEADPFYCRERIFPIDELCGIEHTTLEDVKACDPAFSGATWDIGRLLFLDTETTGLSGGAGTLAFEIGAGFIDERGLVIRQYVMRDYHEEAAMLGEIAKLFARCDAVVSFNGKAFDLPLLQSRMVISRIQLNPMAYPHLDLLHAARRIYKLRLKRCNLAALEEALLGQAREDDLPGAQVPQRFFDYIKTKEFALLHDVLRHNLQDVKSLAMLTGLICCAYREPEALKHPEDLFGVGRTLIRGGRTDRARTCFKILGRSTLSPQAHMHLAISYKKEKEWQEAVKTYQAMIAHGEGGTWPYIELAKYYEHIAKDVQQALRCAKGALALSLNRGMLLGEDERETAAIRRRIDRLRRKQRAAMENI